MSTPRLLADNDALLKAAHWQLLPLVPALAGTDWTGIACLPQLLPRVRRGESKLFAAASVAQALDTQLGRTASLPNPDTGVIAALQAHPAIDAGELLLVGALAATPQARLLTGDKRALVAFSNTVAPPLLQHRFVCVEQMLWLALDRLGAEQLLAQVRHWTPRDQTALAIFGRDGAKSEGVLREGLQSYLHWLDTQAPGLLVRDFGL
jgi:hypothetical protein